MYVEQIHMLLGSQRLLLTFADDLLKQMIKGEKVRLMMKSKYCYILMILEHILSFALLIINIIICFRFVGF